VALEPRDAEWRKVSDCESGTCVEVAITEDAVAVRDSKNPGGALVFTLAEWDAFVCGAKRGEFDV
jgi:hypothetical protein